MTRRAVRWETASLALMVFFAGSPPLLAQGTTASIHGTITDDTGALPGATITVVNEATQESRVVVSGATESGGGAYDIVGLTVHLASRIEGLNKHLGTRVLVSAEVVDRLGGLLTRELGAFRLKGKTHPITIHELICRRAEANGAQTRAIESFAEGLCAFRERSWDAAIDSFRRSLDILGDDEPSRFYIDLCEAHKSKPPQEAWDGVIQMDRK